MHTTAAATTTTSLSNRSLAPKFQVYTRNDIDQIPELQTLTAEQRLDMKAVAHVLPFRVNPYVTTQLIDWSQVPNDPIYQLTFPQPEMLEENDFRTIRELVAKGAPAAEIQVAARKIQNSLNPHPAGQVALNVPHVNGTALPGMQHKYKQTVLFFPAAGQTCHAYCTYCFRWAQFVGIEELKFAARQADMMVEYVRQHKEVRSILFTGGDPMVMKAKVLRRYIEPLLDPSLEHLESIRIGTKSPAYWPYRYVTDDDADDLLRLFDQVANSGRNLAFMAHFSHPRELQTDIAQKSLLRVRSTGAVIRCQAPVIRHVNDNADVWATMWQAQVKLGAAPYYMFVERDTGAKRYFELPLAEALEIFNTAYRQVSGLARTVRGPSMSATPGKILVDGVAEIHGEKVFVLKFLQGRDPDWVGRPFFAKFDPKATWYTDLVPAFGEKEFFYEEGLRKIGQKLNVQN